MHSYKGVHFNEIFLNIKTSSQLYLLLPHEYCC